MMDKEGKSGQRWWKIGTANQIISVALILTLNPNLAFPRDYPVQPSTTWRGSAGDVAVRTFPSGQAVCAAECAEVFCTTPPIPNFTWIGGIQLDAMHMVCAATYYGQPWGISAWAYPTCPFGGSLATQFLGATGYGNAYNYICTEAPNCAAGTTSDPTTGQCVIPCPAGQTRSQTVGSRTLGQCTANYSPSNNGKMCPAVSNPINPAVGNKFQIEEDIAGAKDTLPLSFIRTYNSGISIKTTLGLGWRHDYERFLNWLPNGTVEIMRPDGKMYTFTGSGSNYTARDTNDTLLAINYGTSWKYVTTDNQVEIYNSNGNLTSITDRSGLTQTLTYNTSTLLVSKVTDAYGRSLNFSYDTNNRLSTITDSSGGQYTYTYDTNNNLTSVTYPDQTTRRYLYGESAYTSGISLPNALTGIVDENNNRFATYTYDASGRANSTQHAGGADLFQLNYDTSSTQVTDPLGTARTYNFQTILGVVKNKGQSQPGGSGCGASASAFTYDANGNVASRTDFNGNRTNYTYDLTRNLETSRIEGLTTTGATTPATRTIATLWHPTFRLPVQITNGNQQTTYAYNSQGDITEKTVKDTAANTTRSWHTAYTYSAVPGVLIKKVEDGPRTDVSDLTTYDYYPADAACTGGNLGCRGQLKQITDALGHITQLTRYSANGQLEQLTDPNGLVMTMAYDLRQRLTSLDAGGETTTYTYDPAGQLTRVTRPDGAYLAYSYDPAHRLIKTQDDQGNTLTYTLDAMGNRTKEEAHDPGGQLARSQSRVYDALSRLQNLVLPQ